MIVKLLTEHHLEFLSLKGGCRGSSESTLDKMSNCWKSHAAATLSPTNCLLFMLTFRHPTGDTWARCANYLNRGAQI